MLFRSSHWLTEMGRFARVKIFAKRGTCLSDRVADPPTMEEHIDDMRAVMDATGIERVVLFGVSEGGSMASLFARMVSRIWTNPQCTYLTVETGWSTTLRAQSPVWLLLLSPLQDQTIGVSNSLPVFL